MKPPQSERRRRQWTLIALGIVACFYFARCAYLSKLQTTDDGGKSMMKGSYVVNDDDNEKSSMDWRDFPVYQRSKLLNTPGTYTDKVIDNDDCRAGALCVGPGHMYPIGRQVGVAITGEFIVPALPEAFDITQTTYYDYINIFWRQNLYPGYMNQFVPQLMLGNALANSSNHPLYQPQWIKLSSWHIGAQYFMAICEDNINNHTTKKGCDKWSGRAATGELIAVEPGEGVFTRFELVDTSSSSSASMKKPQTTTPTTSVEWQLTMGVIGDPLRVSRVFVPRPFMGLVANTTRWMEEIYDLVYVGSCLENYGMETQQNYPGFWRIDMNIQTADDATMQPLWRRWGVDHDRECPWQPKSVVYSRSNVEQGSQMASWTAYLEK